MEIIPTWLYTPLICVALGGLLMSMIVYKKKKISEQYQAAQELKQRDEEALYQKFKERFEREQNEKKNQIQQ